MSSSNQPTLLDFFGPRAVADDNASTGSHGSSSSSDSSRILLSQSSLDGSYDTNQAEEEACDDDDDLSDDVTMTSKASSDSSGLPSAMFADRHPDPNPQLPSEVELGNDVVGVNQDEFGGNHWAGGNDWTESLSYVEDPLSSLAGILGQLQLQPDDHHALVQMVTRAVGGPSTLLRLLPPVRAPGDPPQLINNYFHDLAFQVSAAQQRASSLSNPQDAPPLLQQLFDLQRDYDHPAKMVHRGTPHAQYSCGHSLCLQVLLAKQALPLYLSRMNQDYTVTMRMNDAGTRPLHIVTPRPGATLTLNDGYPVKTYTMLLPTLDLSTRLYLHVYSAVVTAKLAIKVMNGEEDSLSTHERRSFQGALMGCQKKKIMDLHQISAPECPVISHDSHEKLDVFDLRVTTDIDNKLRSNNSCVRWVVCSGCKLVMEGSCNHTPHCTSVATLTCENCA